MSALDDESIDLEPETDCEPAEPEPILGKGVTIKQVQ